MGKGRPKRSKTPVKPKSQRNSDKIDGNKRKRSTANVGKEFRNSSIETVNNVDRSTSGADLSVQINHNSPKRKVAKRGDSVRRVLIKPVAENNNAVPSFCDGKGGDLSKDDELPHQVDDISPSKLTQNDYDTFDGIDVNVDPLEEEMFPLPDDGVETLEEEDADSSASDETEVHLRKEAVVKQPHAVVPTEKDFQQWAQVPAFQNYIQKMVRQEVQKNDGNKNIERKSIVNKTVPKVDKGKDIPVNRNIIKSPSDTTIYAPALQKVPYVQTMQQVVLPSPGLLMNEVDSQAISGTAAITGGSVGGAMNVLDSDNVNGRNQIDEGFINENGAMNNVVVKQISDFIEGIRIQTAQPGKKSGARW